MKKIILIIGFVLIYCISPAQIRPSDSLYLWVSFSEEKILIDIPESYITYRTTLPSLPKHVRIREVNIFVPELPHKEKLMPMLKDGLVNGTDIKTKDGQLKYLGKVVLLLFYSHNDLVSIPDESLKAVAVLTRDSQVKKEATLVQKWIDQIKAKD